MPAAAAAPPPTPEAALSSSPLPQLRQVRAEATDHEVVLTGEVPSFYLKQMAQEVVRPAVGRRRLTNRVRVTAPS